MAASVKDSFVGTAIACIVVMTVVRNTVMTAATTMMIPCNFAGGAIAKFVTNATLKKASTHYIPAAFVGSATVVSVWLKYAEMYTFARLIAQDVSKGLDIYYFWS